MSYYRLIPNNNNNDVECNKIIFNQDAYLSHSTPFAAGTRAGHIRFRLNNSSFAGGATEGLIGQYTGGSTAANRGFILQISASNGLLRLYINSGTVDIYSNAGTYFNANQWYDVQWSSGPTYGTYMIVNGVVQSQTSAYTGGITYNGVFGIGGNSSLWGPINWIDGDMSKVVFYTEEKSSAQLLAALSTNPTAGEIGLKEAFLFPEGSGSTTEGVNGNTLTFTGETTPAWGTTPCNNNLIE